MSGEAWDAAVPPALAVRMEQLVLAHGNGRRDPDALLDSAITALSALAAREPATHSALDLLAIDGLITAAFAASRDAEALERRASEAASRLMALGHTRV